MVEIIRDDARFKALEPEWNWLLERSGQENIFLTFDWLFNWRKIASRSGSLFIVVVRKDDNLLGIAPLVLTKRLGFRQLRFLGFGLADYEDIITYGGPEQRGAIVKEMFRALTESGGWDILKLERLKHTSPHYPAFSKAREEGLGIYLERHKHGAPYLKTSQGEDAYYSGLSKKFLADTKRQRSRLFKENEGRLSERITEREVFGNLLEELIALHISRRRTQGVKSIFEDKPVRAFFRETALKFFEKGIAELCIIRHNGALAAMHLGFRYKNKFFYYLPVFNKDFEKYSIGRILLSELIQRSFRERINEFDFMLGEEKYKESWNPEVDPMYYVNVYPGKLRGYAADRCLNRLNIGLKKMLGKEW